MLLVNQFHDILPGTSIGEVNERARAELADVEARADALARRRAAATARGAGQHDPVAPARGRARPGRRRSSSPRRRRAGPARVVEPGARATASRVERTPDGGAVLENAHLRATLTAGGAVASLVHRATGREALAAPANRLELYEDRPAEWDAWDIDPFHLETRADCAPADGVAAVTPEPLRAEVAFERPVGARSRLRQIDPPRRRRARRSRSTPRPTGTRPTAC